MTRGGHLLAADAQVRRAWEQTEPWGPMPDALLRQGDDPMFTWVRGPSEGGLLAVGWTGRRWRRVTWVTWEDKALLL